MPTDLGSIANFATAITVLVAIAFGVMEIRKARGERSERAAFTVVSAVMSPTWIHSLIITVLLMPESASVEDIQNDQKLMEAAHSIAFVMEGIGYAVYSRLIPLRTVDDLIGGATLLSWRRLRVYAQAERDRNGSQKAWEWFQWLAEQLERNATSTSNMNVGAHVLHRDWRP